MIAALRHEDQVIAVMPFNRHQDFRVSLRVLLSNYILIQVSQTYYRTATLPFLRSYFACLFRALASGHKKHIIHRDVKPANFLFDTTRGLGILCDYGLAQKIGDNEWFEWKSECCHSLPGPSWGGRNGREVAVSKIKELQPGQSVGLASGLHGMKMKRPISLYEQSVTMEKQWKSVKRAVRNGDGEEGFDKETIAKMEPWIIPEGWREDLKQRAKDKHDFYKSWKPSTGSSNGGGRAGHLKEDRR